jgi:hypothetical protein
MREAIMAESGAVENAVKLVGEVMFVPGTSQLLDGNVTSGMAHIVLGFAAGALLGPLGALLVGADSYVSSVSGKPLYEHMGDAVRRSVQPSRSDQPSERYGSPGA